MVWRGKDRQINHYTRSKRRGGALRPRRGDDGDEEDVVDISSCTLKPSVALAWSGSAGDPTADITRRYYRMMLRLTFQLRVYHQTIH